MLLKKNPSLQEIHQKHCSYSSKVTEQVEKQDGIIKFFPRYLLTYLFTDINDHITIKDIESFNYICETNVTEAYKLNMYDQIIFLERDLVDSAMSFVYAMETQQMLFADPNLAKHASKLERKIYLDGNIFQKLNFFIFEYFLYLQLKNFIIQKFNNSIILDYDTCVDYVKNNYNNQKSGYSDPKFNYVNRIENYAELKSYILDTFDKYSTIVPTFDFK
jgi:hypothetical protein